MSIILTPLAPAMQWASVCKAGDELLPAVSYASTMSSRAKLREGLAAPVYVRMGEFGLAGAS